MQALRQQQGALRGAARYGKSGHGALRSVKQWVPAQPRTVVVRAKPNGGDGKEPVSQLTKEQSQEKVDALLQELKKTGMTSSGAKQVLKKWQEMGVDDPEQLRNLLVQKTVKPLTGIILQAGLDAGASFGAFYTGNLLSSADFPGAVALGFLAYFGAFYYFLNSMLELYVVATIAYTAYKYGTNTSGLLAAVTQLAGPQSGLRVLDRVQVAVNTVKVIQTLDQIAAMLKDIYKEGMPGASTFQNLSAYLTLNRAKEVYKFDPETYGLSEKQAINIAYAFSKYDTNDDGRLDLREITKLCADLGKDLNEAEVKEALRILDTSGDGFVQFTEFVAWWIKKPQAAAGSS